MPPQIISSELKPTTSGFAIASLILGIFGIVPCGPFTGIPAVIMGHKAKWDIRKSGGSLAGSGMATAGLVTGYLSMLITAGWVLVAIAVPDLVKGRKAAQYQACRQNQASIQGAKAIWAKANEKSEDAVPGDADLFGPGKAILEKPWCPGGGGYILNSVKEDPSCTLHGSIPR